MKKQIIVTTDFTDSSRNALAYICSLIDSREYKLMLVHVYAMPVTYTTEGVAVAAIKEAIDKAEDQLATEVQWVKDTHPDVDIEGRAIVGGGFTETLKGIAAEHKTEMIVMGASDEYGNLWNWDDDILAALTQLPVPVLLVPRKTTYVPIKNIGFACDYRNFCAPHQIDVIKRLVNHTHAQLHVVHVSRTKPDNEEVKNENETTLQTALQETAPQYYELQDPNIIDAVTNFVQEKRLDFLIVIPHKHDIWYSIFHQSHTKQLAKLNNLPILALHD